MDQEESFTSVVKIAGINPYVDVPERVVKALGGRLINNPQLVFSNAEAAGLARLLDLVATSGTL